MTERRSSVRGATECSECGAFLVVTSPQYASCPAGCGRLIPIDAATRAYLRARRARQRAIDRDRASRKDGG